MLRVFMSLIPHDDIYFVYFVYILTFFVKKQDREDYFELIRMCKFLYFLFYFHFNSILRSFYFHSVCAYTEYIGAKLPMWVKGTHNGQWESGEGAYGDTPVYVWEPDGSSRNEGSQKRYAP